ncbi:hypothetical protein LLB_1534 [Legionella longbeachae D-4968]|nr:hypothetical protein LLB_1534 [Legionella longbeachae D-4968]
MHIAASVADDRNFILLKKFFELSLVKIVYLLIEPIKIHKYNLFTF